MFTGIIEALARVVKMEREGSNMHYTLTCPFTSELKIDQSLAHDGCCLTVVHIEGEKYRVTAIDETLEKTALSKWQEGTLVNVERCTLVGGRLDGHIVQGHVDTTGIVKSIEDLNGSFLVTISYEQDKGFPTVAQGSITVNGVSLTVARSGEGEFSVAIIPYTWENTSFHNLKEDSKVNLEFDIIGKYVSQLMSRSNAIQ